MSKPFLDIPSSLHDLAETLGLGVALKLMQHFGGTEVIFPKRPSDELVALLGDDKASDVCHFLGGTHVYIPHGRAQRRREEVASLAAAGRSRREIARTLGVSQRHVRRLANEPPDQLPLFPDED